MYVSADKIELGRKFLKFITLLVKKYCLVSNLKYSLNTLNWCSLVEDELLMVKETDGYIS